MSRIKDDSKANLPRYGDYDWDTPCDRMVPPGYKIALSESRNEPKLAKRGHDSPINGLRERRGCVVSIGEVLEEREDCKYILSHSRRKMRRKCETSAGLRCRNTC
jgi:hypothetical protein